MGTLMTDNTNKTENMSLDRPSNSRMVLLSVVILLAGIVIGSAGTTLVMQKNSRKIPGPGSGAAERMTRRIKDRLELTDEQFVKIEPLIKTYMDELDIIKEKNRPLIEEIVGKMKKEISALLTDDQKASWEKQMKYFERGFQMRRGHGGRRGPGGGQGGGRRGPGSGGGRGMGPGGGPYGPGDGSGRRPGPGGGGRMRPPREPLHPDFPPPPIHDQNSPQ